MALTYVEKAFILLSKMIGNVLCRSREVCELLVVLKQGGTMKSNIEYFPK